MILQLLLIALSYVLGDSNQINHALVEVAIFDDSKKSKQDGSNARYDYELSALFTASGYITSAEGSIVQVIIFFVVINYL